MINKVLAHGLQISQYKTMVTNVLSLINKSIITLKSVQVNSLANQQKQQILTVLNGVVDILIALSSQTPQAQQNSLRILQTTFSLIDHSLVPLFTANIITKIFSILFQFCNGASLMQNISVSALFALIQALFQFGNIKVGFQVLTILLQYLYEGKKYIWAKGKQVKGLVWDLVVITIKNFTANHIINLQNHQQCTNFLIKMYELVLEYIFLKKSKTFYTQIMQNEQNTKNSKANSTQVQSSTQITDFMRYFKAYVTFTKTLSIQSYRVLSKQIVSFRQTIPKLVLVCDIQRNSRMYIFLQSICHILLQQHDLPLSLNIGEGMIFIQVLGKISQQLCWCNQNGIKVNWDNNQCYLDKVFNQQPKIQDGDFVRLIKNTIVGLRVKFQRDQDLTNLKKNKKFGEINGKQTSRSIQMPNNLGNTKRWQIFIKNIIKVIRYLSSLNFIIDQTQQDPTRKIILQLQYWFLLCPVSQAKNMVLQQLLITANVLSNKMQAVKVSQSVQIGSNILYGYYDDLDSMGLTIILKMMAGIKADWEEGKSFEELDQVYNLVSGIFSQESLIKNEGSFSMTIQAIVQCASSLLADIQQPRQKTTPSTQNLSKRSYKMIQFLLQKLIVVIDKNLTKAATQWNFITGFLITLCINKNFRVKQLGIKCIGILVSKLLKAQLGQQIDSKKQIDIISLYQQLCKSKLQSKQLELTLIDQLKSIMPRIKKQGALMDGFRIVKIISDNHDKNQNKNVDIIGSIHELQQILIKQCIHRITQIKCLKLIVQGMQIKAAQKNQQYRLINLLWAISDYFKKITPTQNITNQYIELWQSLFKCLWIICQSSKECETKQSTIHTMTQILGQVLSILPFDFVIVIVSKYYHQMVLLLLGIRPSSITNSEKAAQTAKTGLKNYLKLFKKLMGTTQNKSKQQIQQIMSNFNSINESITKFLVSHLQNQPKNTGTITQQLLYELCFFICAIQQDKGFQQYNEVKQGIRDMFASIQNIIKYCQQHSNSPDSGVNKQKIDIKSHMFKKKLKQMEEKVKGIQAMNRKKQESLQNGQHQLKK